MANTKSYRHESTCQVVQERSGRKVDADVISFKFQEKLVVNINKQLNLTMRWNGKVYEGHMAGLDFVTAGPVLHEMKDHSKGRFHR
jgi:hypothetical protein